MTTALEVRREPVTGCAREAHSRGHGGFPPVVILGGGANALALARSLGRYGAKVYAINVPDEHVRHCRFATWISMEGRPATPQTWTEFLLGPRSDYLRGAVLLAAGDAAIEIVVHHREALADKFLLDDCNPQAQLCMLNKASTYQTAVAAGLPTPRFWLARNREQIEALRPELVFPLLLKPELSHVFQERFACKFLVAKSYDDLSAAWGCVRDEEIELMLVELIPGPDDLLCSYYTYLDEDCRPLFHYTKRVIRRNPPGMGGACYHVTDWIPELCEPSLRLFQTAGLRGLANVEFKRDPRDGQLKLIECNARFTAALCLNQRSGLDLARFVYNRIADLPQAPLRTFRKGVRLWYPYDDFTAFRSLRRQGLITFRHWAASILHRQCLPYFSWSDPLPSLVALFRWIKPRLGRLLRRK